jgi:hypothetical protein
MSVLFIVTPVVANMAWPLLASVIAGSLTTTGYNMVKNAQSLDTYTETQNGVDLDLKNSEDLNETMGEEEKLVMERDGITLTFSKGADNRCKVHVSGPGKSKEELTRAGQEASNKIVQAYAYNKVMAEAKKRGMQLIEEKSDDGRIRLKFRKWS